MNTLSVQQFKAPSMYCCKGMSVKKCNVKIATMRFEALNETKYTSQ